MVLLLIATLTPWISQAKVEQKQKEKKRVTSEAGLNIPSWGIAIDAVYDSRLDNLVPGYKILNVVLSNRGPSSIYLDSDKDKWFIHDNLGKKKRGINHLRSVNEPLWASLPTGLREKLEYPHAVRVGHSTKIDLFFEAKIDLSHFREISWDSTHFKKEFNIFSTMEKNLELEENEQPIPKDRESYRQSMEKYEGTPTEPPPEQENWPSQEKLPREPVTIPMD